jgi:HEAT repeat protein
MPNNHESAFDTEPAEPEGKDRWVKRLVAVPLLIVAVCVGIALLFNAMIGRTPSPSERLQRVRAGGPNEKWQSAAALTHELQSNPALLRDPRLQAEVLAAFRDAEGDDPRVRQYLAGILGEMQLPESVPVLCSALKDPNREYVVATLEALAKIGSVAAYDAVVPYATIADPNLRKLGFFVLGRIKDPRATPLLESALNDQDFQVRVNAIFALANLDDQRAVSELTPLLDRNVLARNGFKGSHSVGAGAAADDMEPVLLNALTVAGHFREASLRPSIERLRDSDPNPQVQRAALEALAQIARAD